MLHVFSVFEHFNHHVNCFFARHIRVTIQHLCNVGKTFRTVQCRFQISGLAAQLHYSVDDFIFCSCNVRVGDLIGLEPPVVHHHNLYLASVQVKELDDVLKRLRDFSENHLINAFVLRRLVVAFFFLVSLICDFTIQPFKR